MRLRDTYIYQGLYIYIYIKSDDISTQEKAFHYLYVNCEKLSLSSGWHDYLILYFFKLSAMVYCIRMPTVYQIQ